jgi:hypothetical protein
VNHGSVWEHAVLTFEMETEGGSEITNTAEILVELAGRPGVLVTKLPSAYEGDNALRFTANLRAIREWDRWSAFLDRSLGNGYLWHGNGAPGEALRGLAAPLAPLVFQDYKFATGRLTNRVKLVEPRTDDEVWCSLFFTNVSRAVSHEQVRHKYQTAVSQRSTRYCDESESPWLAHPVLIEFIESCGEDGNGYLEGINRTESHARSNYAHTVETLERHLVSRGLDALTARKQARGAARGVLGQALMTEFVFSASLAQWKRMIEQRHSPHADAEIRECYGEVIDVLRSLFPERGF